MKPAGKKKLALAPETLRTLSSGDIDQAVGGLGDITHSCLCGSGVCSIVGDCKVDQGNKNGGKPGGGQ
jgi:hypothetical protein